MPERRSARRFEVTWFLHAAHPMTGTIYGRVVNVSLNGILFLSPQRFQVGDLVEMEIAVSVVSPLRCIVRIIREENGLAAQYAYGAEFHQMPETTRSLLSDTLMTMQQDGDGEYTRVAS